MPYIEELAENLGVEPERIVAACDPQAILVVDGGGDENSAVAELLLDSHRRRNLESKVVNFARYDIYSGFDGDGLSPRNPWREPGDNAISLATWRSRVADGHAPADVWRAVIARCVNEQVGFPTGVLLDAGFGEDFWEYAVAVIRDNRLPGNGVIDRLMAHQARGRVGEHAYRFLNPVLIVFDMLQIRRLPQPEQESMLSSLADATFWATQTDNVRVKVFVTPEMVETFEGRMRSLFKEHHLWWLDGVFSVRLSE